MKSGAEQTRIGVVGPYRSNGPGKLPSVDWQMHMTPGDTTLSNSRIVSSAEKAFVVYKGDAYEVPESDLASFRKPGGASSTSLGCGTGSRRRTPRMTRR